MALREEDVGSLRAQSARHRLGERDEDVASNDNAQAYAYGIRAVAPAEEYRLLFAVAEVGEMERETGLEPATLCLGSRRR